MAIPTTVYLINQEYINQFSHLNNSVEWAYLAPSITDAQQVNLQPILGTDLFDKIIADTAAGSISGAYLTLKDTWIKPMLLQWTLWHLVPHLKIKIDNGGIVERISEYTSPAGMTDTNGLRNDYLLKAQFHTRRLNDYLCENSDSFPEYSTNDTGQMDSDNARRSFPFGVVNRNQSTPLNQDPAWRSLIG